MKLRPCTGLARRAFLTAALVLLVLSLVLFTSCVARAPVAPPSASPETPPATPAAPATPQVPAEYSQMYATLKDSMDKFDAFLASKDTGARYPVVFAAELLPANGNRGPELLRPQVMQSVKLNLDRLQELGVQGVTFPIGYPLYTPDFPGYQDYRNFFTQVAQEVHRRGMKLDVESAVVFANTDFSPIKTSFAGLTFEQYEAAKRQMAQQIIQDLQPDYLDLGAEPDTMAALLGMRQLNNPERYTEYVNYVLKGLNRGNTKVIAGVGTWSDLSFARSLASNTSLDAIAIHIYPVVGESLSRAVDIAGIAAQSGKGLVMDECWLYKVDKLPATGVGATTEIFKRDSFSFWAPLDQQFLASMARFSRQYRVEFVSPFWSSFFFGQLDYSPDVAALSYGEITARANRIEAQNLLADKFTPTGEFYKKLIQQNP